MLDELKDEKEREKKSKKKKNEAQTHRTTLLSRHILWSTSAHKAFADDAFHRVRIALLV